MMNSSINETQNIRIVNYFDDLKIISAFHRKFPCHIVHRKTQCIKGRFSIEMISHGEVYLYLDDQKIHLKSPCIFWIGEDTKSFQFELIPNTSYEHRWIDFAGERGRRIYQTLRNAFPESYVKIQSDKRYKNIFEYFSHKFLLARRPVSTPEDVLKIEQIMYELASEFTETQFDNTDPHGIKKLAANIAELPFEKRNLPTLASELGLSYVHFRTLFKETTGLSIKQYILKQQMLTAGELLKSKQFRIGELADYCNFDDITSFTRAFKRYYKMAPTQYLEEISKNS